MSIGDSEGRSVTAATIEAGVWDYVKGLLADPAVLQARYEAGRGDPASEPREEQECQRIERKLQAHRRQVRRLIDAYQAEAIELDELQERRQQLDAQGRFLRERLSELERQRQEREQEVRLLQGVEAFCSSIRTALEEPSWEVKRQVLELVVDQIVVEDAEVIIRHIIPAGPVRLQPRR
jgi:site-specific DNA recombinase